MACYSMTFRDCMTLFMIFFITNYDWLTILRGFFMEYYNVTFLNIQYVTFCITNMFDNFLAYYYYIIVFLITFYYYNCSPSPSPRHPTSCGSWGSGLCLAELCGAPPGSCWAWRWPYCCCCWPTLTQDTWWDLTPALCFSLAPPPPHTDKTFYTVLHSTQRTRN